MDYIFIDESGELAKKSKFFVIGAIIVNNSKKLDRIINKIRKNYKKQLQEANEIKGTKLPDYIIKKLLKKLNSIDFEVHVVILDKQFKYNIDFKNNYNYLYDIIASELAKELNISSSTIVYIDKSKNKEKDIINFNNMFLDNLNNFKKLPVTINHSNSVNYKGLQVIDIIVWSVFKSVEDNNSEFIDLIKNIHVKRVFEDWRTYSYLIDYNNL